MSVAIFNFLKYSLQAVVAALLTSGFLRGAQSISHYGVTLHFLEDRQTGKFANGEPWIIGPVTITGIDKPSIPIASPAGGAMINPVPGARPQGFCPRFNSPSDAHRYDAALDDSLKLPLTLKAGDSLIVARCIGEEAENSGGGYRALVESIVGFIFLTEAPPEGSFRPGLYGTDHTVRFNVKDIDWSVLKNLEPVPNAPTQAWIEKDARLPALPWWEWTWEWSGTFIEPIANCGAGDGGSFRSQYGREIAWKWSKVALWLNLNHTRSEKEKTMIQTIQCGIDLASYFANGGRLAASGGHQVGRKFPLLLAAVALKDPAFLNFASEPNRFVEDLTTFTVPQSHVGLIVEGGPAAMYAQEDVGKAEWGINHAWAPAKDDRRWRDGILYRFAQWPAMMGQVFAAELMGIKDTWGHPPIFAYTERFLAAEPLGDTFEGQMWDKYKLGRPSTPKGLKLKR